MCVDFEGEQVLRVLVVCGRGCCGKWGVTPGDLYGCRKINVDNDHGSGWQYPRAYMWLQGKASGMRSACVCGMLWKCLWMQAGEGIRADLWSARLGLKQNLDTLCADKQQVKRGSSGLLFQVDSQELLRRTQCCTQ